MSSVLKSEKAAKVAFTYQPKPFRFQVSEVAKDFVEREKAQKSSFQVSSIVSEAAGIEELRRRNIEAAVEETVLQRMKEIEEQAYRQAYDLGLIEGEKKAFNEARAQLEARLAQLDELLAQLDTMKIQVLQQNEIHLVNLAFRIAEKIALHEIAVNKEPLGQFIKEVVEGLAAEDRVNIHVAQDDFQFIEDLRKRFEKQITQFEKVRLIPETEMQVGGCLIETNFGAIDATVEQRVAKVWETVKAKFPLLKGHHTGMPLPEAEDSGGQPAKDSNAPDDQGGGEPS